MVHTVLFFIFAVVCVAGALNLLLQKHPIYSALSLIVVMGSLALLYLLLGAEFVAAVQIIVYAGAIMVLFVFVIMLLNAGEEERAVGPNWAAWLGAPAALGIVALIAFFITRGRPVQNGIELGKFMGTTTEVAKLLFKQFLLPFEVTSVLILIAIMGAVVLARREQ